MKAFLRTRSFRVSFLLLTAFTLVCTQLPLLNYLGFEFSALLAVSSSYLAGLLVLNTWERKNEEETPMRFFPRVSSAALLLLVPPVVIMLLNMFFVKNCSLSQGLLFVLLLPVPAVFFAGSLALLTAVLFRRWRKTWFTLFVLVLHAHLAWTTFGFPQVFVFNPIIGYFPGVTYDESLEIFDRLLVYRLATLLAAGVAVLSANIVHRSAAKKLRWPKLFSRWEIAAGTSAVAALAGIYFFSNSLGLSSSESSIKAELGGEYETEHFIITYPAGVLSEGEVKNLALRHEFYYSTIARELRIAPTRKIHSFLYATPEQKGRLIGAAATNISKPWLWQFHLNLRDVDGALKHEMVHVMAAEFGFPLLRISLNSGLIEGLATAMERVEYDETLHRLAAQIYSTGLHPDVTGLFSTTGFLRAHGGTSYVIAGSFCSYLIDQYGVRRFKWLYRTGSFESFYNKSLDVLVAEWRRHIERQDPSRQEQVKAAYLFRRPSIFGKECARVIANLNGRTRVLLSEGRFAEAAQTSGQSLDLTISPEAIFQHANALFRLGKYEEAIEFSFDKMRDSTVAHVLLPLYMTLGDAYWALGLHAEARQMYEILYSVHISLAWDETAGIRMAAVENERTARKLRDYVVSPMEDSLRLAWLRGAAASGTHEPLLQYLLGRELFRLGKFAESIASLEKLPEMKSGILEFSRYRMLGRAFFESGNYQKAKSFFWESLNFTSKPAHQIQTTEWLAWCDWMEERKEAEREK